MDKLKEIISTFDAEYIREFRVFINRQKQKQERKDLKLFDLLCEPKNYKADELIVKLYGKSGKSSPYHALRKRLFRHITEFIVLKQMEDDATTASSVMGMDSLVRYLFKKKSVALGWIFLRKAEEKAQKGEQYLLLNNIYLLQMEWSDSEFADSFELIEQKWMANKHQMRLEENAVVVLGLIRHKLKQQRLKGTDEQIENTIKDILTKYDLDEAIFKRPKLLYTVLAIIRSAYLGRRNIKLFEQYAIRQYEAVKAKDGFSKHNHFYQLSILYMITHVLYRNFKFRKALQYLEEFRQTIDLYDRSHYVQFYPKYVMLKAAICAYTNESGVAVHLYEEALKDKKYKLNIQDELNIRMNLSVFYFMEYHFDKVLDVYVCVPHSDKWMEKKMGKEWLLKKNMIEILAYCDIESYEVALSRIRSFERYFRDIFESHKTYKRAKIFISYVKKYINNPNWLTPAIFENDIVPGLGVIPGRQEDMQSITFYSWLKAKAYKKDPYTMLREVIENTNIIDPSDRQLDIISKNMKNLDKEKKKGESEEAAS